MAIGKVGSFATVAPIQGNPIGEAMAQVEDNAFKYRAEQRLEEERKRLAKEKADAELETDLGKIKSDTTKFSTQNALIIDAMTKLKNGVGEKAKEMNAGKISRLEYNIYKSNAESQIALIDQSAKRINAQAAAYASIVIAADDIDVVAAALSVFWLLLTMMLLLLLLQLLLVLTMMLLVMLLLLLLLMMMMLMSLILLPMWLLLQKLLLVLMPMLMLLM
jgi:hypothetical protein